MAMERPMSTGAGDAWKAGDVASGWQKGVAAREQALTPVTELMFHMAGVSAGMRVLDLGAGTGDQTVLAAQRTGPGGSVLATDISGPMLDIARNSAVAAGLANIETRVMDAQDLDLPSGSFDAAIARFSLQFVPDVQRALVGVRRVLKPGGRLAVVVFSSVERNAFRAAPQAIASRLAGQPFPAPGPGQWALNDPGTLESVLQRAGFRDVESRAVPFVYRFDSLAEAVRNVRESQPPLVRLLDLLTEADRAAAWAEIERTFSAYSGPDGFAGPAEALIGVGTA